MATQALKQQKTEALARTLTALLDSTPDDVRAMVRDTAQTDAADIAQAFYRSFLEHPDGRSFLTHTLVQQRLVHSMTQWVAGLFVLGEAETAAEAIARNFEIGMVHARVNVPVSLVNEGIRVIRRELVKRVVSARADVTRTVAALGFVTDLLDSLADAMHEAYLGDMLGNVRQQQSLKMFMTSQNLALETERLKSSLFDWLRNTVVALYDPDLRSGQIPSVEHSDFGLWLNHKAELTFGNVPELEALRTQTRQLDIKVDKAVAAGRLPPDGAFIKSLNAEITQVAYLLSILTEKAMEIESGRDTLTRLLSRRFLPSIMQREVGVSIHHNMPFSVVMIDADHFKSINDTHGHAAGDLVLSGIADLLLSNVRAGDFVFRYGGEEFLVMLTEMDPAATRIKAEALRQAVEQHMFTVSPETVLPVTVSVGVAIHDGHPDYERTIRQADEALLTAKREGRNRVVYANL